MMMNPPHPGSMIRTEVLDPLRIGVAEAARRLGVSRVALSRVVNGHAGISAELAVRLERAGISTARFWLGLQTNYELAAVLKRQLPPVERLQAA